MDTLHDGSGNSVRILRALLVVAVIVVLATIACNRYPDLRTHPVHGITQVAKRLAGQHEEQINTRTTTSRDDPHIADLLGQVRVVDTVPTIAGYQRSCATNSACVFGPAWTDDTTAALSRNGCDTRNDILRQQLSNVQTKPGTHGCKVIAGQLDPDPYTGRPITLAHHGSVSTITIDHIFALERAWNLGASTWPLPQRETFANDPRNLLAVDAPTNSSKGAQGISDWLPPNTNYDCTYITRYLEVAAAYHLPITTADRNTAEHTC